MRSASIAESIDKDSVVDLLRKGERLVRGENPIYDPSHEHVKALDNYFSSGPQR